MAVDVTVYTRETLVADFVAYMRFEQHLSKYTVRNYEFDLQKFDRYLGSRYNLGSKPWQEVDRADLRGFIQHLHELGFKIASIRRAMACLRAFYKFLRIEGYIQHSPVEDMPRMKVPVILPRFLEWEKVEALIRAPLERQPKGIKHVSEAGRYRNYALLELLTATGIRISEAVGLRLHDVQLGERACIRVYGKGNKERTLPLHDDAAAALRDYIERWRPQLLPQSDHVFVTRYGLQVGRRIVQYEIKRYAAAVGITERVYPHLLRHSYATAMVRAGIPLPVLQELLGHVSIATTAIYTHVSPEHLRASYLACHPANARRL
jgi:site-specific recombinase XerD